MAWVRIDDSFYDHPKLERVGPLGLAVWVSALAYCNRNRTDGKIPKSAARRLVDFDHIISGWVDNLGNISDECEDVTGYDVCEWLVAANLFEDPGGRDYLIHDYLDYQPSADEIEEMRRKKSEAGRAGAASRWDSA